MRGSEYTHGHGFILDENGHKQWWEEDRHHRKIRYELLEERPPVGRVVRIADPDLPYGGTWTFDISPSAGGSEIRITENGEIYNVFFRFLARFVFGYNASIEGALRELGSAFGEQVKIEP